MPKTIKIRKGLDIRLKGTAEKTVNQCNSTKYAIKPTDFIGIIPKLLVKENDIVQAGTPLFYSKADERIKFVSPVSGTISEIVRGEKRLLTEIRIESDNKNSKVNFGVSDISNLNAEEVTEKLIQSGLWSMIRQRPYHIIANPDTKPKSVFISGFDSNPLAPDYDFIFANKIDNLQIGIDVLKKLTNVKIFLNLKNQNSPLNNLKNVEINYFSGPHPSGNIGVHIHNLDPINKGEIVWIVNLQDLIAIGSLFANGKIDFSRTIALTGSEVVNPQYYNITLGESIENITNENTTNVEKRFISGNVLNGTKIENNGYLGFYDSQITVIPEGNYYEFMGWASPGIDKFSLSRTFFSWLFSKKHYSLDTNYHGELRNFVVTGQYEKVFPMAILPVQLLKSIIIKDIDLMEKLGIYEVAEEDFALCEFVCTSKIEAQQIVRQGIELMQKEMS